MPAGSQRGLLVPGNIDLFNRPEVRNADGTTSTVRSVSFEIDGREVLVPTVVGNRVVSDDEALAQYRRTGQHLGIFSSRAAADAYAKKLHEDFAKGKFRKMPPRQLVALIHRTMGPEE